MLAADVGWGISHMDVTKPGSLLLLFFFNLVFCQPSKVVGIRILNFFWEECAHGGVRRSFGHQIREFMVQIYDLAYTPSWLG